MQPDTALEPRLTWFIYYRVDPAQVASAMGAARLLMTRISATCPGLRGQLMQRPSADTQGGQLTMMEIYQLPPSLDAQAAAVLRHRLDGLAIELLGSDLAGQRHVEVFVPCV